MDTRIRELQELIARYGAFAAKHNEEFADSPVHSGCKERMDKILDKWRQELANMQGQHGH